VRAYGFTERQARFLVLVLEHVGVCLPRQYRTLSGVAHGRETHGFFGKLIAGGFATTDVSALARAHLPRAVQAVVTGDRRARSSAPTGDERGSCRGTSDAAPDAQPRAAAPTALGPVDRVPVVFG
jgi:hypothetical protein